jgi:hypothetical protein
LPPGARHARVRVTDLERILDEFLASR